MSETTELSRPSRKTHAGEMTKSALREDSKARSVERQGWRDVQAGVAGGRDEQAASVAPPVDIFEDEAGITLLADLPGVPKERLGIKVTGDTLVIEGTANVPLTGDLELLYGEVHNSQYRRSFTLSRELDPARIDAKLTNGVLRLRIPKAEEARPRRINVSVG